MAFMRHLNIPDVSDVLETVSPYPPSLFGQVINEVEPLLGGHAERGCLVLISIGDAVFGTTASDVGDWVLDTRTAVPLSGRFDLGQDGRKSVMVMVVDANGRSQTICGEFTFLTKAPEAPTLATVRTFCHQPLLDGHAQPGSHVEVTLGGAVYLTVAASGGAWSVNTAVQKPVSGRLELGSDGRKVVRMTCIDVAGNSSCGLGAVILETVPKTASVAIDPLEIPKGQPWFGGAGRSWRAAMESGRGETRRQRRG